jgi:Holliday junction resolvase RusA-like endonuclease
MVGMFLTFAFEPAPSLSKKKREALIDCRWHTIKPDMDNLEKAIKDGLNKVAYSDDCQVAFVCKTKIYSDESYIDIVLMDADEFKMKEVE